MRGWGGARTGCWGRPHLCGVLTFSPLGPVGPLMPGSPASPGSPSMPGAPGSPGLPAAPWQKEGTGRGGVSLRTPGLPPGPPLRPLSPSALSGRRRRACPGETKPSGSQRPRAPQMSPGTPNAPGPKTGTPRAQGRGGGHSPLCRGARPCLAAPVLPAQPAPSLPLPAPGGPGGTARRAHPVGGGQNPVTARLGTPRDSVGTRGSAHLLSFQSLHSWLALIPREPLQGQR